jgi:hypothetical protein
MTVQRKGVQHGWVGGPIIQMLVAHLKLLTERPPIMEATPGSCGIAGIEPSPDMIFYLPSAEFANGTVAHSRGQGQS